MISPALPPRLRARFLPRPIPPRAAFHLARACLLASLAFLSLPHRAAGQHSSDPHPAANRVLVIANSSLPESVELAQVYMRGRSIPDLNLIALPLSLDETISWPEFARTLWNPLRETLAARRSLNLIEDGRSDRIGRRIDTVLSHNIAYLVLMRGVPLRLANAPEFIDEPQLSHVRRALATMYGQTDPASLENAVEAHKKNEASVDSELSLLALSGEIPHAGPIPNPLFGKPRPSLADQSRVIKVSRLDGPDVASVRRLIQSALDGERSGLMGRAYIDQDGRHDGGYKLGNDWLASIHRATQRLGFPSDLDPAPATLPETARFDAPAIYFGWWTWNADGPFQLPGFRFPPGAIAVHLHSFSAETLRKRPSENESRWCGPLVSLGAAATIGNVFEPYLQFTVFLDAFFAGLTDGMSFADAFFFGLPVLSWQAVALGDPLYRPFLVPLQQQVRDLSRTPLNPYKQYVALRQFELDRRHPEVSQQALSDLKRRGLDAPGLALAFTLSQALHSAGDTSGARDALRFLRNLGTIPTNDWALARQIALFAYDTLRDPETALAIYRTLLGTPQLTDSFALLCLPDALLVAQAAGQSALADRWMSRLRSLQNPR